MHYIRLQKILICTIVFSLLLVACTSNSQPPEVAEQPTTVRATDAATTLPETNVSATSLTASLRPNELFIPPLLEPTIDGNQKVFNLFPQHGTVEFLEGAESETMGFNGNYLGPTIRVDKGDDVVINVTNQLNQATATHWHGMHVPPEMDGTPHQLIPVGETWQARYPILNEAATMWYHPHPHGTTTRQVALGLAGLFIIDDDNSKSLAIPQTYGVDDIPLIVQDRLFNNSGVMIPTQQGAGLYYGDQILANGTLDAWAEVPAKHVRLRLLNGSLARIYSFGFDDGREFYQIASDGGLLESPVAMTRLKLATGERAEIIVDVSDGQEVLFKSYDDPSFNAGGDGEFDILRLVPDTTHTLAESDPAPLPKQLNTIARWKEDDAAVVRPIRLGGNFAAEPDPTDLYIQMDHEEVQGGGGGRGIPINGKIMEMTRIDEVVMLDDIEIWELTNAGGLAHPFHIHDIQFQVLDRNGEPPPANEMGWKDTVLINRNETVRVIMKFETYANQTVPYMFHCHILEHEDGGMMGQFIVVDPVAEENGNPGILAFTQTLASLNSTLPAFAFALVDPLICEIPTLP